MQAVVVQGPGRVSYREVPEPFVGGREVLVHSHQAGLCRTDIEMITGTFTDPRWVRFPLIPGHEWAGTVLAVGNEVESVAPGDRVVCEGLITCGRCRRCANGQTHWCERIEAVGFTRPGGYAELVSVPEQVVHRLPEHVSFDAGVLIEPASVVLHGLQKARPALGETVAVVGVGTLGAIAITMAKLWSPSAIVAHGVREEELELGRRLGATDVVRVDDREPPPGDFDLVIETAGAPAAVKLAAELCRPGGRAVLLGIAGEGRTLTLPSDLLTGQDIALIGSVAYPRSVWAEVVQLVGHRVLSLEAIVTHRFPIDEFARAVALMDDERRGAVAKVVLEHR